MKKIILVRSPDKLIEQGMAGYGWQSIDFSSFTSFQELMNHVKTHGINVGRHKNQMSRFFNAKEGDIVVVPVHRAIVIGVVKEGKSYQPKGGYGANRISVDYFADGNGKAVTIPRAKLSQGLESRLKIRMTVAFLNEFSEEIETYIQQLKDNNTVCFDSLFQQEQDKQTAAFKEQLLAKLRNGTTNLQSGGYGLEVLIKELMEIEGYTAHICAKNKTSDISDIDIEASRTDPVSSNRVFIQVKHHDGITNDKGIRQLAAVEEDEHVDKWLITSGTVSDSTKNKANEANISIMEGEQLVEWIYTRINELSRSTKEQLRIGVLPQIVY